MHGIYQEHTLLHQCMCLLELSVVLKEHSYQTKHDHSSKGRHIYYEKQKRLRKVCMFFQIVHYAGNICISRNFSIAPSHF